MKNDPEDIRQTAAGDPHYAGTEPDGGCRGGRGIPELCLSVERLLPTEPELKKRRCAS